jgi:hypothetical protein
VKSRLQCFVYRLRIDRGLLAPLALAAVLRVALMLAAFALTGTQVMTQGDTSSYLGPGLNLMQHGSFTSAGAPELDRTPGYPIFAMLTGMASGNVLLTCTIQIVLSLVSLLLIAKIADRVFPNRNAGAIAAWLYAVEPLSMVSTVRVMPETLFVFLLLVVIERVFVFQQTHRLSILALAGAFLAVATYVRPVSYYLGFALAIGIAFTAPRQRGFRWKAPIVFLLTFVPSLALWQTRNYVETGYSGFSSIVEQNLYYFQSAEISAELEHISLVEEQTRLGYTDEASYFTKHPEQRAWPVSRRLHFMREQSVQILRVHPALYLKSHIRGVGVVAFTPCATELLQLVRAYPPSNTMPRRILNEGLTKSLLRVIQAHPGVAIVMAILEIFLLALYVLAMRGCFVPGRERTMTLTLVCIAMYFLLISGGAQAIGRYRSPVMPEVCILAAGGLAAAKKNAGPSRPRA